MWLEFTDTTGYATMAASAFGSLCLAVLAALDHRSYRRRKLKSEAAYKEADRMTVELDAGDGVKVRIENVRDHPWALEGVQQALARAVSEGRLQPRKATREKPAATR